MGGGIIILGHHLSVVIARYYFQERWKHKLELIKEQHGEEMVSHVRRLVNDFFDNSAEATVTIVAPDSFCNPDLSSICRGCLTSLAIDTYPTFEREKAYREYQLERIGIDEDYRTMRHIFAALDELTFLLYYNLEPWKYPSQFLIKRIDEVGKKISKDSTTHLPSEIGYSSHPSVAHDFPSVGRLRKSELYEDFIERSIEEKLNNRRITAEELDNLKRKYPLLFTSVGSDKFYYAVLNILSSGSPIATNPV